MESNLAKPAPHAEEQRTLIERIAVSVPTGSRRDLLRASAVMGAAGVLVPTRAVAGPASVAANVDPAQDSGSNLTLAFNPFGQPIVLDPHRAPNWGPFWVLFPHLWSGLLRFNEDGAVVNDLAESFAPNETADVWTATIRPDLVFESGNPVNAQAFVDSWKRVLDPDQPAPMTVFFAEVDGFSAFTAGESAEIGFEATDELTIEIRLSRPFSSFPAAAATFGWAVLDLEAMNAAEEPSVAVPGLGMWKVTDFDQTTSFVMEPHPNTPTPVSSSISSITWRIVDGTDATAAALSLYRDNVIPIADVPGSTLAEVEADEALAAELVTIESPSSTLTIGMDFNQVPFNDVRYRQAVAHSIDRNEWATTIQGGNFIPAQGIVPPAIVQTAGYAPADMLPFSPDDARSLLESAGYDPETAEFEVVYYQDAAETTDAMDRAAALLAMIEENSGLVIRHDTSLTADQIARLADDNGGRQFDIVWWWADTDTPSFLESIAAPDSPAMAGAFNWNAELEPIEDQTAGSDAAAFTELIADANASTDQTARNAAFQEAEQLLLSDAVLIPLGHWVQRFVQKPWLTGTRQGPWSGSIPVQFDEAVEFTAPEAAS